MVKFKETILNQPIEQLDFSKAFKTAMETLAFHTVSDLLQNPTKDLEDLPGFSILFMHEYVSFMEQQGLGHYIDPV